MSSLWTSYFHTESKFAPSKFKPTAFWSLQNWWTNSLHPSTIKDWPRLLEELPSSTSIFTTTCLTPNSNITINSDGPNNDFTKKYKWGEYKGDGYAKREAGWIIVVFEMQFGNLLPKRKYWFMQASLTCVCKQTNDFNSQQKLKSLVVITIVLSMGMGHFQGHQLHVDAKQI